MEVLYRPEKNSIKFIIYILIFICAFRCFNLKAQISYVDSLLSIHKTENVLSHIESRKYDNESLKRLDKVQIFLNQKKVDSSFYYLLRIDTTHFYNVNKARYYKYLGQTHNAVNESDIAFSNFQKSYTIYESADRKKEANEILLELFNIIVAQEETVIDPYSYLELYGSNAFKNNWQKQIANYYYERGYDHFFTDTPDSIIFYLKKAENYHLRNRDSLSLHRLYITKGHYYTEKDQILDSSLHYLNKALDVSNSDEDIFYTLVNRANSYRMEKESQISIQLLKEALQLIPNNLRVKNLQILYGQLSNNYDSIGNKAKALDYLRLNKAYADSLNVADQNINLIRYRVADNERKILEQENEILVEQAQKKKNRNIALGLGGGLLAISIIAFLTYRNTKRKQRIAEQEKELEIQKTTQILKEKEVETINAMVEGQEKERLRLAGELHDNLGSTLATVKMQVENLERNLEKVDDPKSLLSKTNTLINEAYQKVRRISHERNSGVMAKEGLLPAVKKLAKQISFSGSLRIEVQDFGLENRLSNHLEITIFRILQELTTNIVKHANATEASISLTQHDNELNIMVEDNGQGFKVGKLEQKEGMGLGSIERRVEHLEGSMEVDSAIGKGTNIIIDIPLETPNNEMKTPNINT